MKKNNYYITDRAINDSKQDGFKYNGIANSIKSIIEAPNNKKIPINIGIAGDWGIGKTSLINLLKKKLGKYKYNFCVIDSWRFEKQSIRNAILYSVIYATSIFKEKNIKKMEKTLYASKEKSNVDPWYIKFIKFLSASLGKIIFSIGIGVALFFLFTKFHIIDLPNIIIDPQANIVLYSFFVSVLTMFSSIVFSNKSISYSETNSAFGPISDSNQYLREYENIVSKSFKRLIVIIDDVDRLNYDLIKEVLSSIKVFMNIKNVVFIVLYDEKIIKKALSSDIHYGCNFERNGINSHDLFLEKLFQYRIYLNPLPQEDLHSNFRQIIDKKYDGIKSLLFGIKEKNRVKPNSDIESVSNAIDVILDIFVTSPAITMRHLKNMYNAFVYKLFLSYELSSNGSKNPLINNIDDCALLALTSIIEVDYKELYGIFVKSPNLLIEIRNICNEFRVEKDEKKAIQKIKNLSKSNIKYIKLEECFIIKEQDAKEVLNGQFNKFNLLLNKRDYKLDKFGDMLYINPNEIDENFGYEKTKLIKQSLIEFEINNLKQLLNDIVKEDKIFAFETLVKGYFSNNSISISQINQQNIVNSIIALLPDVNFSDHFIKNIINNDRLFKNKKKINVEIKINSETFIKLYNNPNLYEQFKLLYKNLFLRFFDKNTPIYNENHVQLGDNVLKDYFLELMQMIFNTKGMYPVLQFFNFEQNFNQILNNELHFITAEEFLNNVILLDDDFRNIIFKEDDILNYILELIKSDKEKYTNHKNLLLKIINKMIIEQNKLVFNLKNIEIKEIIYDILFALENYGNLTSDFFDIYYEKEIYKFDKDNEVFMKLLNVSKKEEKINNIFQYFINNNIIALESLIVINKSNCDFYKESILSIGNKIENNDYLEHNIKIWEVINDSIKQEVVEQYINFFEQNQGQDVDVLIENIKRIIPTNEIIHYFKDNFVKIIENDINKTLENLNKLHIKILKEFKFISGFLSDEEYEKLVYKIYALKNLNDGEINNIVVDNILNEFLFKISFSNFSILESLLKSNHKLIDCANKIIELCENYVSINTYIANSNDIVAFIDNLIENNLPIQALELLKLLDANKFNNEVVFSILFNAMKKNQDCDGSVIEICNRIKKRDFRKKFIENILLNIHTVEEDEEIYQGFAGLVSKLYSSQQIFENNITEYIQESKLNKNVIVFLYYVLKLHLEKLLEKFIINLLKALKNQSISLDDESVNNVLEKFKNDILSKSLCASIAEEHWDDFIQPIKQLYKASNNEKNFSNLFIRRKTLIDYLKEYFPSKKKNTSHIIQ